MSGNIDPNFWAGKRVFMTGHTGFKGSWMCKLLGKVGAQVHGFSLAPSRDGVPSGQSPFFEELGLSDSLAGHHIGDIRDREALSKALRDTNPDVVIHMAAQPLVRLSYAQPVETYETNVMGTVHLLDACRNLGKLTAVLIVSSDKCYENRETIWGYREDDPMGGHDPYSNSKGCTELVTSAFRNSFFHPKNYNEHGVVVASGRAGNVMGGGDWSADRLIPDAMRAALSDSPFVIRNPSAVRPWQHVLDPLSGYLKIVEMAHSHPVLAATGWNFGPSAASQITVGDLATALKSRIGTGFNVEMQNSEDTAHEANLLTLDCTAAIKRLGWSPKVDLLAMLEMTTEWYLGPTLAERNSIIERQVQHYLER